MIDALKTSGPKFSMDGKTTKSEETIALTALSCGLAESSSVYIAATNSDVSIIIIITSCLITKSDINIYAYSVVTVVDFSCNRIY